MEWTREKNYATNSAARLAMIAEPALVGGWESNTADITIAGVPGCHGDMVFRVFDFSLEAMVPRAVVCGTGGRLLWKFSARGGEALPVSGVLEAPGYPVSWSLTDAQDQTWLMQDGYPAPTACTPTASTPSDPGDFEAVAFNPADPGSFNATAFSPLDPGDFEAAAFSPADPGDFDAPAFAPANPGDFTFSGFSPSDPGDGSVPVVPGMLVAGTLTPNATGFLPQTADIGGKPAYSVGDANTVFPTIILQWQTTTGTAGRWVMGYYPNISGSSMWRSGIAEFALQPTPDLATGWATAGVTGSGATPAGTPTFTAIP
jgi:hypothetical protein